MAALRSSSISHLMILRTRSFPPYASRPAPKVAAMSLLRTVDLRVAYGSRVALAGVSLEVDAGAALAVAGPNGAGKTSLLRAVSGLLDAHGGRVTAGRVELAGGATVAPVLEGRRVFRDLTVAEDRRVGGFRLRGRPLVRGAVGAALARLPWRAARRAV